MGRFNKVRKLMKNLSLSKSKPQIAPHRAVPGVQFPRFRSSVKSVSPCARPWDVSYLACRRPSFKAVEKTGSKHNFGPAC